MRILHVNKFFDLRGGAEVYMHALMERQRAAGHDVHAFSTRSPQNLPSADADRFVTRYDFTAKEGFVRDAKKAAAFLWNRDARRAMALAIRETKPDVIHLHNVYHHLSTSILGPIRASRIPCVQTLHDYKLACPNYKMFTEGAPCERCKGGRYAEAIRHHCLTAGASGNVLAAIEMGAAKLVQAYERTVRVFICPSRFMADKMASWGEPPSKLRVVPNPTDASDRPALRDGGYVLAAGRLSPEKGIETLIRAAASLPSVPLRIAGSGPEEARLRSLAASLGATNVTFLGFLRKADLESERRRAMALAVPSVWYENAPLAVLEALADGLPVIASRIGGLPELVEDGVNGLLVEPRDVEAWRAAIRAFADLPSDGKDRMADAGRKTAAERFSWEAHLAELTRLYASVGAG